jgi:stress response protein YsnF
VEVTKTPYVKEEVSIKKKPVTEAKEVTEEVISERIDTNNI